VCLINLTRVNIKKVTVNMNIKNIDTDAIKISVERGEISV